jgi:hypothetical protein
MWGKDSTDVKIENNVDAFLLTFAALYKFCNCSTV